ncbi:MAG: diguanylate cyclase [Solirubrobacteraceae bacterium]
MKTLTEPQGVALPTAGQLRRAGAKNGASALALAFGEALRNGDTDAAEGVIDKALTFGLPPENIQSLVIAPAMVQIGELWETARISVGEEHLATAISQKVLLKVFEQTTSKWSAKRWREKVLLAAVEGQRHVLGLRMVADVLEAAGFSVLFLGEDVPTSGLRTAIARHRPAIVGLTYGMPSDVTPLADSLWAIHDVSPETRVMLGGRAVPPGLWAAGYPRVVNTIEVVGVVEDLLNGPPQTFPFNLEALRSRPPRNAPPPARTEATDSVAGALARAHAQMADAAGEQARRTAAFRAVAYRDPLTGLANQRGFEEHLAEASGRATSGSLLMIDLDAFKTINEEHGLHVGDELLRAVGQMIGGALRPDDFAARIGGDEFAVHLPATPRKAAEEIGESLREAVTRHTDPSVSVSVGVAEISGSLRAARLLADAALYEAKAAGRDRVVGGVPR